MKSEHLYHHHQERPGWNVTLYKTLNMMLVRVNLRVALCALCASVVVVTVFWSHCGDLPRKPISIARTEDELMEAAPREGPPGQITCLINGEYAIGCRREGSEVFLPFSFVHKYFEVYGRITTVNGEERFEWSHSYSKVYHPKRKYDPRGTFTTFENYNVEVRDRVKCISGVEEVPVSIQWDPRGFFYPTQIAQFGLAHYSKNITEPEPRRRIIDDGETVQQQWTINDAFMTRTFNSTLNTNVLKFATSDISMSEVFVNLNITQDFLLSMDVMLRPNASVVVALQNKDKREFFYLHYVANTQLMSVHKLKQFTIPYKVMQEVPLLKEEHIYYGIGVSTQWRRITRDLIVDMQKGMALLDRPKRKAPRNKFKITSMHLYGAGNLDNITVSSSEHNAQFFAAAKWLVANQRPSNGGWPIPVRRRIAAGVAELKPGWHSAMSQGHAISVLARAYHRSGDVAYLRAAKKALYLLDVPSTAGGVKAMWMDKFVWYEEYPTSPPLFVLNGFIYTLLGLYDLHVIEGDNSISLAKKMFDDGMASLKILLPLFDTGSGSFYDLRHFTLGVSPNIARWDYHATHINQLYLLAGLDKDPILIDTARRWEGYMQGKRAAHN